MSVSSTENNSQPKFVIFPRVEVTEVSKNAQQSASPTCQVVSKWIKVRKVGRHPSTQESAEALLVQSSLSSVSPGESNATVATTSSSTLMLNATHVHSEAVHPVDENCETMSASGNSQVNSTRDHTGADSCETVSGTSGSSGMSETVSGTSETASETSETASGMSETASGECASTALIATEKNMSPELLESESLETITKLTKAEIVEALQINPSLLSNVDIEFIASVFLENWEKLKPLINHNEPIVVKVKGDEEMTKKAYAQYIQWFAKSFSLFCGLILTHNFYLRNLSHTPTFFCKIILRHNFYLQNLSHFFAK